MSRVKYSIILPTYNEAENISFMLREVQKNMPSNTEIIVIDDNSPDKTWKVAEGLRLKGVRVIRRIHNTGLCSAIQTGIDASVGEYIGWMDADMSHTPKLLTGMLQYLLAYDAVSTSRYLPKSKDVRKEKNAVLFSYIINKICSTLLYNNITDYTSGYILIKKSILKQKRLQGDYGEYFIDLLCFMHKRHMKIIELPLIMESRARGVSKTATGFFGYILRGRKYVRTFLHCLSMKYSKQ